MLIKIKEKRKKKENNEFGLLGNQTFPVSLTGGFGILDFLPARFKLLNVLQKIFPSNLFTGLFPLSNAGSSPTLVFSCLLSNPSFTQIQIPLS